MQIEETTVEWGGTYLSPNLMLVSVQPNERRGMGFVGFVADGPYLGKVVILDHLDTKNFASNEFAVADLCDPQNMLVDLRSGRSIAGLRMLGDRTWGGDAHCAKIKAARWMPTEPRKGAKKPPAPPVKGRGLRAEATEEVDGTIRITIYR